jgi:hypothetical protein
VGFLGGDPVRDDVLSFVAPFYVVLSCVDFANDWKDDNKQKVACLMSRKAFEKYQYHYVSLLRTDSWNRVQSGFGSLMPRLFANVVVRANLETIFLMTCSSSSSSRL